MDAHILEVLHWSSQIEVFLMSMHMYLALCFAREMVLLMLIFTLRRDTAGEIGSPGYSSLSPSSVRRTRCVSCFCGRMLQMKIS